jgi:hypothetical protein
LAPVVPRARRCFDGERRVIAVACGSCLRVQRLRVVDLLVEGFALAARVMFARKRPDL